MSEVRICPMLMVNNPVPMSKCKKTDCAWFDYLAGECCIRTGTDYLRAVSDSLEEKSNG